MPDATNGQMMDALHKAACDDILSRSTLGFDALIGEGVRDIIVRNVPLNIQLAKMEQKKKTLL